MKKIFTLIAAVAAFASVNAQQLYLIGDSPLGNGWNTENVLAMNLAADGYTNSITVDLDATKYFAVCTGPTAEAGDWGTMNGELRWAPQAGNMVVTKGEYKLGNGYEGTMVLTKGNWTLTVDARTMVLVISTDSDVPTEDYYCLAGSSSELFTSAWDGDNDANKMEKQSDGSFKKTYNDVSLPAGDIQFKVVKNGAIWIPDGTGNDNILNIPEDGTYNVVFTYDPAGDPDQQGVTTNAEATNTTGISLVKVADSVPTVYYNLKGQRVNANTKGILIANGKKIVR